MFVSKPLFIIGVVIFAVSVMTHLLHYTSIATATYLVAYSCATMLVGIGIAAVFKK